MVGAEFSSAVDSCVRVMVIMVRSRSFESVISRKGLLLSYVRSHHYC